MQYPLPSKLDAAVRRMSCRQANWAMIATSPVFILVLYFGAHDRVVPVVICLIFLFVSQDILRSMHDCDQRRRLHQNNH